jgi:hypothetical protein
MPKNTRWAALQGWLLRHEEWRDSLPMPLPYVLYVWERFLAGVLLLLPFGCLGLVVLGPVVSCILLVAYFVFRLLD